MNDNPAAFVDAFWDIKAMRIYETFGAPSPDGLPDADATLNVTVEV